MRLAEYGRGVGATKIHADGAPSAPAGRPIVGQAVMRERAVGGLRM